MDKPRRMTGTQARRARSLVRRLCANYDGGNCLLLDNGDFCICPQISSSSLLCNYFRTAVLPADRELYREIVAVGAVKYCVMCGKPIFSRSNSAKYCPDCAIKVRRKQDRERKAKTALHFRK